MVKRRVGSKDCLEGGEADLGELLRALRVRLSKIPGPFRARTSVDPVVGIDFRSAVADYEKALIVAAQVAAKGDHERAAELLRIDPATLQERIRNLQIDVRAGY